MSDKSDKSDKSGESGKSGKANASNVDEVLMARIVAGDRQAFGEFVRAYLPRIISVATRMLGSEAEAQDAAQDISLKVWKNASKWKSGQAKISTWLHRIAVNHCIDRLRQRKTVPLPEGFDQAEAATQEDDYLARQRQGRIQEVLQLLPERQRTALVLFHFEELSMIETAEIMETSVESVQSLLARGRRVLKESLKNEWQSMLSENVEQPMNVRRQEGVIDG